MTKDIRFYKQNNEWFADVPETIERGGTEADNEMVAGADKWLNILSDNTNEVTIRLSDKEKLNEKLERQSQTKTGATYIAHKYDGLRVDHTLWICAVTLLVFNNFPKTIHYKIVQS